MPSCRSLRQPQHLTLRSLGDPRSPGNAFGLDRRRSPANTPMAVGGNCCSATSSVVGNMGHGSRFRARPTTFDSTSCQGTSSPFCPNACWTAGACQNESVPCVALPLENLDQKAADYNASPTRITDSSGVGILRYFQLVTRGGDLSPVVCDVVWWCVVCTGCVLGVVHWGVLRGWPSSTRLGYLHFGCVRRRCPAGDYVHRRFLETPTTTAYVTPELARSG